MFHEEQPTLLDPTPAAMPPSAPPETEEQRLMTEIAFTLERFHGYKKQMEAEEENLNKLWKRAKKIKVAFD